MNLQKKRTIYKVVRFSYTILYNSVRMLSLIFRAT